MSKTYSEKLKDPRWQKKRLEILNRDNFTCVECGSDLDTLHIHHIAYINCDPWDIDNSLLLTLCEECHKEEEDQLLTSKKHLIEQLKLSGFGSSAFSGLAKVFMDTNRGWYYNEPAWVILKMVVDDDEIWESVKEIFWNRLEEKVKKEVENG